MTKDTREGGDAGVRDLTAGERLRRAKTILEAYSNAASEERCESLLAREMAAAGWTVTRQPWCWSPQLGWRRPDIHAVRWNDATPDVLVVELKHDDYFHLKRMIEALEQSKDYRLALVWCDAAGRRLLSPTDYAISATFLLRREGISPAPVVIESQRGLMRGAVRQYEQMAWRDGVLLMYRQGFDIVVKRHEPGPGTRTPKTTQRSFTVVQNPGKYDE